MQLNETGIDTEFFNSLDPDTQKAYRNKFPSVFWIPNRAQERPGNRWTEAPYPRTHVVTFGNRSGKTEWLGEILAGAAKGNEYVNPQYCQSGFFDDLAEKRMDGTLTIWWICTADMMKENAPNYKIIKSHIPDAIFKRPNNTGVFKEIHIPVKGRNGQPRMLVVPVKTHDQETISFAGDNVDLILCDEPPPQKHWPEISARMVTLYGEAGGRIIIGGTPAKVGNFLLDIIEDADENESVAHDKGSIWENCHGSELPKEMAEKYNIPYDHEKQMYDTRGHLSLKGIEHAINNWKKSGDPDILVARIDGEFTHIQGRIYKNFSRGVHTIPDYTIPENYPIVMICDPHDTRPDCAGWYMITPRNKLICVMEYPTKPYELLTSRSETIPQTCEIWSQMEAQLGISKQVVRRYGDPNYMLDPDPYTKKTKQQLYQMHGFYFQVNVNDKHEFGHEAVRQFLYYDKSMFEQYPGDPLYQPQVLFFDSCRNHIVFMTKYSVKEHKDMAKAVSETPEAKWKDFADLVRYAIVTFQPFTNLDDQMRGKCDFDTIKKMRNPQKYNMQSTYKGREIVIPGVRCN